MKDPPPLESFQDLSFPLASLTETALIFCAPCILVNLAVVFVITDINITNPQTCRMMSSPTDIISRGKQLSQQSCYPSLVLR